ncbi:MAG: NADH-dependent [FeFe] hydrogenase, group A6 [Lachnospiraceae bacterium]|nr:NADH-dependent [FeFe] hydrogenase, group A6 [Lachnospiraceae bacterium]MDY5742888.1 NADH-dependent [FeFe] hydrogenase, group A6 [Lachnospiraceae bacterium]
MVNLTIENMPVQVAEGTTILEAAKQVGIKIPSLCYLKDLNEIGACKVCVVQVEGRDSLLASCCNAVQEGMNIIVNNDKVRRARKINVELILSQHSCDCPTCFRSGNCSLQNLANELGILECAYEKNIPKFNWNKDSHLIRNDSKCIKCMRCVQICDKVQSLGVWDVANTGSRTTVAVNGRKSLSEANCTYCGQCVTHCPVGALQERDDVTKVFRKLNDSEKIVIAQIAPAVRVAWGEYLGLDAQQADERKLVAALKKIGFDYVFDTNFAADLTIMEEGTEFLKRFKEHDHMPMFTSCCPAWVSFCKSQFRELVPNLSTAKSPQQMFSSVIKNYYAQVLNVDPEQIFVVSFMPCMAKKDEITRKDMDTTGTGQDTDVVLTTRELIRMLRRERIMIEQLEGEDFDQPLGLYSGAGAIFGATGGVMEAALRTVSFVVTGKNPTGHEFKDVRGDEGIRYMTYDLDGTPVKVGIATGLGNARTLMERIKRNEVDLDFVEVMACPGGCVGGGGQPIQDGIELAPKRAEDIYQIDENCAIRCSHDNPMIRELYDKFFGEPMSEKAHHLLHVSSHI